MSERALFKSRDEALGMLRRYESIIIRVNVRMHDDCAHPQDHQEFDDAEQALLDALCGGPTPLRLAPPNREASK